MTLSYNSNRNSSDLNSNFDGTFELRFATINNQYLSVSQQFLNKKFIPFLNQTRSLKQLIRVEFYLLENKTKKNYCLFF